MRILVLSHEYPPVGAGGGRVAEDICRGLSDRGHDVVVLTSHLQGLPTREVRDGIRIQRVRCARQQAFKASLPSMVAYIAAGLALGARKTRPWKPDVIHAHFAVPAGALAFALSRLTGAPYLLTIHGGDVPGGDPQKTGRWFRLVYPFTPVIWRSAAKIVSVSEFLRRLALQSYDVDIAVIPGGVRLAGLPPVDMEVGRPPRIVFAGRLTEVKQPLLMLRVLARLKDLPWRCEVVGDGPLHEALEQEIAAQALGDRVVITGWLSEQEALCRLAASDILFMPSQSESGPIAGLQALGLGLAIVASRVGRFPEMVVEGQNGFLCAPDDESGFEAGLRRLLSDREALARARRTSYERRAAFDIAPLAERYEALMQEAVLEHRGNRARLSAPTDRSAS